MILPFTTQKQILPNWCWAAVTSSVSFYYDPQSIWLQSAIAANLIDKSCFIIDTKNSGPSLCDTQMDISQALRFTKNLYQDPINRQLSYNEIIAQINYNSPICCQIVWPSFGVAHYISIYGYEGTNVIIGDPEAGIFSIPYADFCDGYRDGKWSMSFFTTNV